ncbi:hypothetical protein [Staphylococcus kloosii]|uniref:Uncharacterized protein n=1 Tax=Staphylococcus kloosii TaxID=29384 RepID=A0ABQ0XM77_9STAP|nr:hypothetical protein [Staphylococcus kloosii]AVQ35774.1 hypothetical protein C7J89_06390 [Staphylococcus kloosii]PNZ05452.1 hypothetical protein CD136_07305 [Staphylococcus kloosii]GEP82531.1 hypothetical protein SKL01_17090 [Staphylococcus kloosii]SUM48834.1 Uncharacterised protein [Staphylococcus kloosii]
MIKQLINSNEDLKIVIEFQDEDGYTLKDFVRIEMWALYENGDIAPMVLGKEGLINGKELSTFRGFHIV